LGRYTLVICDEPNVASATAIQRLGGQLEDVRVDELGTRMARYWIA
jgi:predicted acetyltransferase